MPKIFLDSFANTGTRFDYFLDLIFDEMIPNLRSSAIDFERKNSLNNHIHKRRKNLSCDLNIIIRPGNNNSDSLTIFHKQGDSEGLRASEIFKKNLMLIHDFPNSISINNKKTILELEKSKIPCVFIELFNISSKTSKNWIKSNVENIGQNLAISITEFFGLPFIPKCCRKPGKSLEKFALMNRPNLNSNTIVMVPSLVALDILGQWEDWYVVEFDGYLGYVNTKFVNV